MYVAIKLQSYEYCIAQNTAIVMAIVHDTAKLFHPKFISASMPNVIEYLPNLPKLSLPNAQADIFRKFYPANNLL